jgi:hypothetical protein
MCSVDEKPLADSVQPPLSQVGDNVQPPLSHSLPGNDSPQLSPRRRKKSLLPEITRLALEGHSGQAIARKVKLPKRTVNHWLQKLRQEWAAKAAEGAGELYAFELARLDSIYREAMQAWRESQTDMKVRLTEHVVVAGKEPRKKKTVRTQPQRANAALLTKAMAAVMASTRLKGRKAPKVVVAKLGQGSIPAKNTKKSGSAEIPESESLAEDKRWLEFGEEVVMEMRTAELYEANWRLANLLAAQGGTMPAELKNPRLAVMDDDELYAHRELLKAAIHRALYPAEDSSPDWESSPPQSLSNQGV